MKKKFSLLAFSFFLSFSGNVFATEDLPPKEWRKDIILVDGIYEYHLPFSQYKEFFSRVEKEETDNSQKKVCPLEENNKKEQSSSVEYTWELDKEKLDAFLLKYVVPHINQEAKSVRIFRDESGNIAFDGVAQPARWLNLPQVFALVKKSLETEATHIALPIVERAPQIIVEDAEFQEMGIRDLLSVGESDFSGSTWDRIKNISIGASTMTGVLIPKGGVMSFNEHLGPVTAKEGYVPELVILGPKVEKEYGGGLCQVSSTAFRMALLAGLPILERWQHSFAVHYYEPWGTDATIYPGVKDMRFQNNTEGALLIQTVINIEERKLYFLLYGTKDERKVHLFSSRITNRVPPLSPRLETSTNFPPGYVKRYSGPVAGFDVSWSRFVVPHPQKRMSSEEGQEEENFQPFFSFSSRYQPRGLWEVRGVAPEEVQGEEKQSIMQEGG